MVKYTLVNPSIEGSMDTSVTASNGMDAAKKLWQRLSEYLSGNVDDFAFTLQSGGDLSSYRVNESCDKEKNVSVKISELELEDSSYKKLREALNQSGGKKKSKRSKKKKRYDEDDSDSDIFDDDDDDIFRQKGLHSLYNMYHPINRFWYYPYLYTVPTLKIKALTIPTFVAPLVPQVQVWTNPVYWTRSEFMVPTKYPL